MWVFVGRDADGKETVLFEIEDSAGKRVPTGVLGQFEGIVGSDSDGFWSHVSKTHQKCLLHYFRDMYRTTEKNDSGEFNLFFMELYGILKDTIVTRGHGSDGAVESPKYRIVPHIQRLWGQGLPEVRKAAEAGRK